MDKRILEVIGQNYNGGPVGANTIAIAIGEERQTLEEVHEPFLIQEGYLQRTPQGRVLTSKAWQLLGIERKQGELY
jgi:Holliday junction DNA helicase RuvB